MPHDVMNLDARTLLFSLIMTYALSVLSLFAAAYGRNGHSKHDGMEKWAVAMLLETFTWTLIAVRGTIPDIVSIIIANGCKATAHALILAAIYEFQRRTAHRWQYWVPVVLTLLMAIILLHDTRGRFIWGSLIYAFQMVLIARALLADKEARAGRAWYLLFGGIIVLILVLMLRAIVSLVSFDELAQLQNNVPIHPVQIAIYITVMGTALLGTIGFVLMVKERGDREIMRLAMTDSLTQIPNRRALMEYAERALARRSNAPLVILMIDVDHFKEINDTHGHQMGDEVLHKIAEVLTARLRRHDFLGRYGGEEFCVIAPDTAPEGGLLLAKTLCASIAATSFHTAGGELSVSVSVGVACCPANASRKLDEVLAEADDALYAAKQAGRNKVVCYETKA